MRTAPPSVLYHYTSLDVFLKIVEFGKLWASNFLYLNDASELAHFEEVVKNRISFRERTASDNEKPALAKLKDQLWLHSLTTFVTSFSTKRDDLSQWRGYCQPGLGVCIGFKSSAIISALDQFIIPAGPLNFQPIRPTGLTLTKVEYIENDYAELDGFIEAVCGQTTEESIEVVEPTLRAFSYIAPTYKHPKFADEGEWRIVIPQYWGSGLTQNLSVPVKFRSGKSTLIPYIEIDIANSRKDFISEIIVGPSPNLRLSVASVLEMLQLDGMSSVTVRASDVPYRHW